MAAETKVRKAERLASRALSSFRKIIADLERANGLHVQAHSEHLHAAVSARIAAAQSEQAAADARLAIADNNAVKDKLTDLIGS